MIASSPSICVTKEFAPPPKVGARIVPAALITDVALTLIGAELIDFLFEVGIVHRKEVRRQIEALPARIVPVKAAFEVTGDRNEPAALGTHADRIELERREAEIVIKLPQLRQLLHERRNERC